MQPSLADEVPIEVKRKIEVARSALVYGYLFYPLYSLGIQQLFLSVEAAISHKYSEMGGTGRTRFSEKVEWLESQRVLMKEERERWDCIRKLRN